MEGEVSKVEMVDGRWLTTHDRDGCIGRHCVIHNPSKHPLKDAPMNWRDDRGFIERICAHGVGHPDPDDLAYKKLVLGQHYSSFAFGVHACDGCCGQKEEKYAV